MSEVEAEPLAVKANGHTIECDYLVIATHVPLMGKTGLRERHAVPDEARAVFVSYAVGARSPQGTAPRGQLLGHVRSLLLPPRRSASRRHD